MKTRKNTFWHSETYKPTADAFAKLAEDFSKKYPGSSVDISVLSWGDVSPKLSSALAAGAPPEVAMGTFWWESKFADMGVQMILDDLYDYFGDVYDFIKDLCYYKGHYYAFDCTIA
ncbi:MAG: extracellular solute-binding protein, partial [Nitrososphaerota archaeon]